MPVSHAVYCAAHAELHGLEDVRRLAEDDRQPLSYDALLCIFSKKQQDLVKRTAGRHRQCAARCAPSVATCAAAAWVPGVRVPHAPACARCALATLSPLRKLYRRPPRPSASYVERYRRGESLEAIANAVQLPPTMLARMVLEELWDLKKGKEVTLPALTATATLAPAPAAAPSSPPHRQPGRPLPQGAAPPGRRAHAPRGRAEHKPYP